MNIRDFNQFTNQFYSNIGEWKLLINGELKDIRIVDRDKNGDIIFEVEEEV